MEPATQTTTTAYDYHTGLVTSQTDVNGQVSTIDYTNQLLGTVDPFGRPGVTKSWVGPLIQWLVSDHLGTPRMVFDQTGTLANVKRHDYLPFVADRIGDSPKQEWLEDLCDHFRGQSSGAFQGWIHPNLDEFITNNERRDAVLALLDDIVSQSDLPREARDTAKLLEALLRGQLITDASRPLDYMVSGKNS
jgi:hypothetical protein